MSDKQNWYHKTFLSFYSAYKHDASFIHVSGSVKCKSLIYKIMVIYFIQLIYPLKYEVHYFP